MEHKIKTIADILSVANAQNLDIFLEDLRKFILLRRDVIEVTRILKETVDIEVENPDIFTWIDDGKNEVFINIKNKEL